MTERDYVAEMDEHISAATEGSGWVAAIVAAKLHAELLETDPDLLTGWLYALAPHMLTQAIRDRERSARSRARFRAGSRRFAAAAAEAEESGDVMPMLGLFASRYVVDEQNTRKVAADMTGPDHLFVAGSYQRSANEDLMLAAFHKAVAKKVGKRRTADVLDEAAYEQLYRSVAHGKAA